MPDEMKQALLRLKDSRGDIREREQAVLDIIRSYESGELEVLVWAANKVLQEQVSHA